MQAGAATLLDRLHQIRRRLLAHSVELGQRSGVKGVEVRDVLQSSRLHESRDELVAQAFDVHGLTPCVVLDALFDLGGATGVRTAQIDLVKRRGHVRAANGARFRHAEGLGVPRAFDRDDLHHFRNHLAPALDHHQVADADVFPRDFFRVVKRGARDGGATHEYRDEPRDRCELPRASDLNIDRLKAGACTLRRKLVGDGPARKLRRRTQLALQGERVHLDDYTVDVVVQIVTAGS